MNKLKKDHKSNFEVSNGDLAKLKYLAQAEVDPAIFAVARMSESEGFELPQLAQSHLFSQALINTARLKDYRPPIPQGEKIWLGEVALSLDVLPSGMGIFGATGMGKTNSMENVMWQLNGHELPCSVWDLKGEGRRLVNFWPRSHLFTFRDAPWHLLEPPPGVDPVVFGTSSISEIRGENEGLHDATIPLVLGLWRRIVSGLKPGDPYPSIYDFRRLLEREAARTKRENYNTAARIFLSLEIALGPNARVRKAPDVSGRYNLQVFECVGEDTQIIRTIVGLHFNKLLLKSQQEEHTTKLRSVEIIDEAAPLCSISLKNSNRSNLSSVQRFSTMSRFIGIPLIFGAQNISQVHPFMKNAGTIVCFKPPSMIDALEAQKTLGLPSTEGVNALMSLGVGEAFIRSIGWDQPVRIKLPEFHP